MALWPGGARGALSLSFDNLGVDEASAATRLLPALLERLAERELTTTFFAEGVNAELDPDALRLIAAAGHEVAYHAWRHEGWGELKTAEQAENLARGVSAFGGLGIELAGLRPPGGQLGAGGVEVLREAGLRYASPAGEGAGVEDDVALLPFLWRHVDASCVLPPLAPVREQMVGSPDPVNPDAFHVYLKEEIGRLEAECGFMIIVLHLSLLDWLGEDKLGALLDRIASTDLWAPRCSDVAEHVLAHRDEFHEGVTLDPTTWAWGRSR